MEGSIKAVIYARYSSDNQREESIEGQIRECTAFAEKTESPFCGITLIEPFQQRLTTVRNSSR